MKSGYAAFDLKSDEINMGGSLRKLSFQKQESSYFSMDKI